MHRRTAHRTRTHILEAEPVAGESMITSQTQPLTRLRRSALISLCLWSLILIPGIAAAEPVDCDVPAADSPLDPVERTMLNLIDRYRAELGFAPLQVSPSLQRAARWKAVALAAGGARELTVNDHDDLFRSWDTRILDCGYPASADFGENLGGTDQDSERLLQAWKDSPTHDANLRDPRWTAAGVARATTPDGFAFWVTVFGSAVEE
jgi:uncharacterized protein YkwD